MKFNNIKLILAGLLLTVSGVNIAAEEADTYQSHAILGGELADAERELIAVLEEDPNDPYALLNLAFIYQKSGNTERARDLYARILNMPKNPMSELASGKQERVKSIARRGLAHIATQ